ncbi:MAG: hypothetical protein H0X37_25445 [Herpetosiphonaceae bacterium]|nr:hypothetical protein [Herpetosiphonaceae bacterium]
MAARTEISPAVLLLDGQIALRKGQKEQAQALFHAVLDIDPNNEDALLWLSGAVEPEEAQRYLQRLLRINPDNEQAQEGLIWLSQRYGIDEKAVEVVATGVEGPVKAVPTQQFSEQYEQDIVQASNKRSTGREVHALNHLLEVGGHVAVMGALLGFISLGIALRANALFVGRGERGPIGWGGAVGIAVIAALTHAVGLIVSWWLIGRQLAQLRNDHRGNHFRSLLEAGQALLPGYLAAPALGLVLLGDGFSEQRWVPIMVVVAILLVGALLWSGQRLLRLRAPLRMSHLHERRQLVALLLPAVGAGGAVLVVASLLVRLLLRRL